MSKSLSFSPLGEHSECPEVPRGTESKVPHYNGNLLSKEPCRGILLFYASFLFPYWKFSGSPPSEVLALKPLSRGLLPGQPNLKGVRERKVKDDS